MATVTIRNIPDDLLAKIKERAKSERRSLNNELIKILEKSANYHDNEADDLIDYLKKWDVDDSFIAGVEDAIATRTYGRDVSFD